MAKLNRISDHSVYGSPGVVSAENVEEARERLKNASSSDSCFGVKIDEIPDSEFKEITSCVVFCLND